MTDSKKPKRRWYQFSLRTLFIVMTLFAVGLGLLTRPVMDYRREQAILESMGPGNISVNYDYENVFGRTLCAIILGETIYRRASSITFDRSPPIDFDLARLAELRYLRELSLINLPFDDDRLAGLSELQDLEILDLSGTAATDDVLTHLEGMKHLEILDTVGTQVTYAGLRRLESHLPNLENSRQRRAIAELMELGNSVDTNDLSQNGSQSQNKTIRSKWDVAKKGTSQNGNPKGLVIRLKWNWVDTNTLSEMCGQSSLQVRLRQNFKDTDIEHLKQLPQLGKLYLPNTEKSMQLMQNLDSVEEIIIDF